MRSHTEEEKLEGAMKIFEALSGVDEELLLKSESVSHVKQTVVIPFWKYAKALAACVCLEVCCGKCHSRWKRIRSPKTVL